MEQASGDLDFERAAVYRDRLAALSAIQRHQGINPRTVDEADVFAIHQEGGQSCIQVFFFRTGQNWGNRAYFPRADRSVAPEPRCWAPSWRSSTTTSRRRADPAVARRSRTGAAGRGARDQGRPQGRRSPCRSAARRRIWSTTRSPMRARRSAASWPKPRRRRRLLAGFAETFGLPQRAARASRSTTTRTSWAPMPSARMIVAGPEGFVKNQYRKFNIKSTDITPGDDFGMMREVMQRRFSRLLKEARRRTEARPRRQRRRRRPPSRPGPTSS